MHYLIVGGTQGIGRAITEALVHEGHTVSVWARHFVEIPGADVQENDPVQGTLTLAHLPDQVDGVVYCPGTILLKPFARLTENDFLHDWQVNVLGAINTLQALHNYLKKSPQASVVLFSTVAATLGMPYHASIASAKGAIEGLVRSLAAEWAPQIRINAIAPSITQTALAQKLLSSPEKIDAVAKRHPLQRVGTPQDIATMATFLLSTQASWMTGQILHVDGGLSSIKN